MVTAKNNFSYIQKMIQSNVEKLSNSSQTIYNTNSVAVQTGINDDLSITLSHSKKIHLYYSKSLRDYVLSFNLGQSKKFITTKKNGCFLENI